MSLHYHKLSLAFFFIFTKLPILLHLGHIATLSLSAISSTSRIDASDDFLKHALSSLLRMFKLKRIV